MRNKFFIILLGSLCLFTAGCASWVSSPGSGHVTTKRVETIPQSDGTIKTITTTYEATLKQPANPEKGGTLSFVTNPDGTIQVGVATGNSYNLGKFMAGNALLTPVVWAGIGLMVLGAGIGVISKGTMLKPAIGVAASGAGLIVLGYLLSQFAWVFIIALIVGAIVIGWYMLYSAKKYKDRDIAITETVALVERLKTEYMTAADREKEFKKPDGLAATIQRSPETKVVIAEVKEKLADDAKV